MSLITPIAGLIAYTIVSTISKADEENKNYRLLAICLLLSAGSFLYIATMHVMPEVYFKQDVHGHCHEQEKKREKTDLKDILLVILGGITPFFLTVLLDEH